MKTLITIFSLIIIASFSPLNAEAQEVEWRDFEEGYQESIDKDMPLLVNVYTTWCGWCRRMDADTYKNEEIINEIHENFIPVKFNPEEEKTYTLDGRELSGRELLGAFTQGQRVGYPTTLFLFTVDRRIFVESGYQDPSRFTKTLSKILEEKNDE